MTSSPNDAGRASATPRKDMLDTKDTVLKREDKRRVLDRGKGREVERKCVVVCRVFSVLSLTPMSLLSIVSNVGFDSTTFSQCQMPRK